MRDSQTFHSFHAASRASRLIVRGVLPGLILVISVFAVWFSMRLVNFIPDDLTDQERAQAIPLLALLGAIVVSMPISIGIIWYFLDRDLLRNIVTVDAEFISQRRGGYESKTAWKDIDRVRALSIGRLQTATIRHKRGKIVFNAGFVNADGVQPHRAIDFRREYLVYPDGTKQRMIIEENPLYQIVRERAPESAFRSKS